MIFPGQPCAFAGTTEGEISHSSQRDKSYRLLAIAVPRFLA
jgi:hypothetical protein